jgi:hypothetical protein
MIFCDFCEDWFHYGCVGLTKTKAKSITAQWLCPTCEGTVFTPTHHMTLTRCTIEIDGRPCTDFSLYSEDAHVVRTHSSCARALSLSRARSLSLALSGLCQASHCVGYLGIMLLERVAHVHRWLADLHSCCHPYHVNLGTPSLSELSCRLRFLLY